MIKWFLKLFLLTLALVAAGTLWQQSQLAVLVLARIDPLPETQRLIAAERWADAADYLGFFMDYDYVAANPAAQALWREIQQKRADWEYQAAKLREGLLSGTSDETIGQAAGVLTDFFVIGDLRDLAKQGVKWAKGEDVDEVMVALATIGVVASAAQVASMAGTGATAGAAAPAAAGATTVKSSISALKVARKLGQLPPWLGKALVAAAKTVKETKSIAPVADLLGDVHTLTKAPGGLRLLSHTQDAAALKRMARFADTFGAHSATLYRLGGDFVVTLAQRADALGRDTIRFAATFGQDGLRLLDRFGALKFVKYSARASKMAYKGDIVRLLARALLSVPQWVLIVFIVGGVAAWLPWQRLLRRSPAGLEKQPLQG